MDLLNLLITYFNIFWLYTKRVLRSLFSWNRGCSLNLRGDGYYELNFSSDENEHYYKIIFKNKRGPVKIKKVSDSSGEDVTDEFIKMMGPGKNFYGIPTTSEMLGWKDGVKIEYISGDIKYFEKDECFEF